MEKRNKLNYFIIERLDQNEESDCISNIYDLSILNKIKEIKTNKGNKINQFLKNIIKVDESKKISQEKKMQILQVIKKAILCSNLTYKWKLINFKQILIFFHIFFFISTITHGISKKNGNNIFDIFINNTNIDNNITNINNFSINFTNKSNNNNNTLSNSNNNKINFYNSLFLNIIVKQIVLIPVWLIYLYKYIPKWDKINNIVYKLTKYLLLCESYENIHYFYYLMKDFSILVTKKRYYNENKGLLPFITSKVENIPEKNIILYCVNIINDYLLEKATNLNYYELISKDDLSDIKVLTRFIELNLNEKLKSFNKKIIIPIVISIMIAILYNKASIEYAFISLICLCVIFFVSENIFREYMMKYKIHINKFIDNYNDILIRKKRFIYRKKKLIMYLALKDSNYTKSQIINFIEKIINS